MLLLLGCSLVLYKISDAVRCQLKPAQMLIKCADPILLGADLGRINAHVPPMSAVCAAGVVTRAEGDSDDATLRWIFSVATGSEVEEGQAHLARWRPRLGLKIGQLQPGSRHVKRSWSLAALGGGLGAASRKEKGKGFANSLRLQFCLCFS